LRLLHDALAAADDTDRLWRKRPDQHGGIATIADCRCTAKSKRMKEETT